MKHPQLNNSYKALIEAYTEYLQTLGFASSTVYDYPRFIADFLFYIQQKGTIHIHKLTTPTVFEYFTYLEQKTGQRTRQTFSTAHLNRNFGAIDKFLEFLHQMGAQNTPPPTCYTIEHSRKKPLQVLTPDEIQNLYNTTEFTFYHKPLVHREPRQMTLKLVLDLCYGLGLRRSEALNLKLSDVNFDQRIIHVRQGKNYRDRFVPMSKKIHESIQTYLYQYRRYFADLRPGYVYPYCSITIGQTPRLLIKYSKTPSIKQKKPTLHTLRHSIATHLLQNGMDIEQISRFLGHSSLESTQLYTHIVNNKV